MELRRFLEMIQYYKQYINNYVNVIKLFYDMLKDDELAV